MPSPALEVDGLSARYGEAQALREVSLHVGQGELVTLVGRNGAGKTTLLRCVMGLHRQSTGRVRLNGRDISGLATHQRARAGLAYVPQMLAIARALRTGASVLLLDEPTEGLAPVLVQRVASMLQEAKREGTTVLLVEQNLRFATTVADRHYLLAQGQIVESLANQEVIARESELLRHLGV